MSFLRSKVVLYYSGDSYQLFLQAYLKVVILANRQRNNLNFVRVGKNLMASINPF
jgi:hypothetical protein